MSTAIQAMQWHMFYNKSALYGPSYHSCASHTLASSISRVQYLLDWTVKYDVRF